MRPPDPYVRLEGQYVSLEPLEVTHLEPLHAIVEANPEAFMLTYVPRSPSPHDPYFAQAFADRDAGTAVPLAVKRKSDGRLIGTSRFNRIVVAESRMELGFTWLDPSEHGGPANVDAKFVMFAYAFEACQTVRLQVQADARNVRSLAALEALGLTREGTLRRYGRAADGGLRDSVVFSMLDVEWPAAKAKLAARLEAKMHGR